MGQAPVVLEEVEVYSLGVVQLILHSQSMIFRCFFFALVLF